MEAHLATAHLTASSKTLNVCMICFQGVGHVGPAYSFAKRLNSLRKEEADRCLKRSEISSSIYHPLGRINTTIFCQVHIDDLPTLRSKLEPTESIEIVIRVITDESFRDDDQENADLENNPAFKLSQKILNEKLINCFKLFRQDAASGRAAKRVVEYYKSGWKNIERSDKRSYIANLADDEGVKYHHLTLRRNLKVETPLAHPPNCVLADMFIPYDGQVADEFNNCPCWSFHPSNLVMAGFDYSRMLMKLDEVSEFKDSDIWESGNDHISQIEVSRRPRRKGIIINDVEDWYDYSIIDHVAHNNYSITAPKDSWIDEDDKDGKSSTPWEVLCVGPLFHQDLKLNPSPPEPSSLTDWLENITERGDNFIFITMGSQFSLQPETVEQLAALITDALGRTTRTRFLWASKDLLTESLPSKLTTQYMGGSYKAAQQPFLVERWVDQVAVLQHPNLLGVITHGGWNGLLEIMTLTEDAAVLCVPIGAEQGINARCVENYYQNGRILKNINENNLKKKIFQKTFTYDEKDRIFVREDQSENNQILKGIALKAFNNSSKRNVYKFLNSLI